MEQKDKNFLLDKKDYIITFPICQVFIYTFLTMFSLIFDSFHAILLTNI